MKGVFEFRVHPKCLGWVLVRVVIVERDVRSMCLVTWIDTMEAGVELFQVTVVEY